MNMAKKVLLIDDDASITEVLSFFLQEEGYDVVSYPSGLNVEDKVKKTKPNLLLIDYLLPGKNGAEIVKNIRQNKVFKHLPIIMIAANKGYKQEAIKAGVDAFIEKPFDLDEILNILKRFLEKNNGFLV